MVLYNGASHSLQELEKKLNFTCLQKISFESKEEEELIYNKGMAKCEKGEVSEDVQALGKRFKSKIESCFLPDVSIQWINDAIGHGLFAEEELPSGSYVGEYTGVIRRNDLRRFFTPLNNYLYEYPVPDPIGKSYVIDAEQGNLTRFINHSQTPNLKPYHVFYEGYYHLIFLTLCPIAKGSQLCYNYGQNYWHLRGKPAELNFLVG